MKIGDIELLENGLLPLTIFWKNGENFVYLQVL